jgi:hypothetical protein
MMCNNVVDTIEQTFDKWKPRKKYEFIKIEPAKRKSILHPIVY